MKYGPYGITQKISPTAFFGGLTRGKRIINEETKTEIKKIFKEIRSGEFAKEWKTEVEKNEVQMKAERERVKSSQLEAVYRKFNW